MNDRWRPRPWHATLSGCIWLPRMLDKGRRSIQSQRSKQDLMAGYLFGSASPADRMLLRFLRTNPQRVTQLLHDSADDQLVAAALISESGRSEAGVEAWNRCFRLVNAPFILLMESDEQQRQPGIATSLFSFVYNRVIMPPVYVLFGRKGHRK